MTSQFFKEESKLKVLSGVKTKQGRDALNVRKVTIRHRQWILFREGNKARGQMALVHPSHSSHLYLIYICHA